MRQTAKSLLQEVELLQAAWWYNAQIRYNFPFPHLRTVTQLLLVIPKSFITRTFQSIYKMQDITICTVCFQDL